MDKILLKYKNGELTIEETKKEILKNIDIKNINIPNVCFSLTKSDDNREKKYTKQRLKRGFDDSETWSLRDTIARFIIPRLDRFIKVDGIQRDKKYQKNIKKLLKALKLIQRDNGSDMYTDNELKQIKKGLKIIPDIFMNLWW